MSNEEQFFKNQILTYMGNKRKYISKIDEIIGLVKNALDKDTLIIGEGFSGSGIVSRLFKNRASGSNLGTFYVNDISGYSKTLNECFLTSAKNLQAEAEEIQKKVDKQLLDARVETTNLIKKSTLDFQNYASKKLEALDQELNNKIIESEKLILKNKQNSLEQANEEVYSITKIILSKISDVPVNDKEIKSTVNDMQKRVLN